jgi:hypothetical protein
VQGFADPRSLSFAQFQALYIGIKKVALGIVEWLTTIVMIATD